MALFFFSFFYCEVTSLIQVQQTSHPSLIVWLMCESPAVCLWNCWMSLQEVLACGVLLPLINQLSDPDYINQFVIWMVRNHKPVSVLCKSCQPASQPRANVYMCVCVCVCASLSFSRIKDP